jgi:hypothetical protein
MPWEVGKMLLQVQWVPRDVSSSASESSAEAAEDEEELVSIPRS